MRTMENEKLRVQISDHGAELCSIYDKEADREAVWIGDPALLEPPRTGFVPVCRKSKRWILYPQRYQIPDGPAWLCT